MFDDALAELARPQEAMPHAAMEWFETHWAEAGEKLVGGCIGFMDGEDAPGFDERAFFFALHLGAAQGETRLHAPLCGLLLEAEAADTLLGDAMGETLHGLLIATFDGDLAPMQSVIESASSDALAADAALLAIAYLTHQGRLATGDTQAYLARLFETIPREPDYMWVGYATSVAALGLQVLVPQVETLFREGSVPREIMRLADFRQNLAETRADPTGRAIFDTLGIAPFADAVATLASWHSFAEGPQRRAGTIENPMKDVGRNDPCPCGSGKKFKKCCLAAA